MRRCRRPQRVREHLVRIEFCSVLGGTIDAPTDGCERPLEPLELVEESLQDDFEPGALAERNPTHRGLSLRSPPVVFDVFSLDVDVQEAAVDGREPGGSC